MKTNHTLLVTSSLAAVASTLPGLHKTGALACRSCALLAAFSQQDSWDAPEILGTSAKVASTALALIGLLTSTSTLLAVSCAINAFYHFASIPEGFEHGKENAALTSFHIASTLTNAIFVAGRFCGASLLSTTIPFAIQTVTTLGYALWAASEQRLTEGAAFAGFALAGARMLGSYGMPLELTSLEASLRQ